MPRKAKSRAQHTLAQELIAAATGAPPEIELTGARLELWNTVRKKWRLTIADESLLRNAAEALERAAELAAVVDRDGGSGVVKDRFGAFKPHPALNGERDFRGLAARILQQLTARLDAGAS
jgi:hypothetical protein